MQGRTTVIGQRTIWCDRAPTGRVRHRITVERAELGELTGVIRRCHYLRRGRTMAQIGYWILVDGERAGAILYALPRWSVAPDGSSPMDWLELARLWIAPAWQARTVTDREGRTHTLPVASCALARTLRRVRADWAAAYPRFAPVRAVVSWSDDTRFAGTVYLASGFARDGRTVGKPPRNRARHSDYSHSKTRWVRWLEPTDPAALCAAAGTPPPERGGPR